MTFQKYIIGLAVAISLTACGGGGGNASAPVTTTTGTGTTGTGTGGITVPVAADFVFELSKTTIVNGGTDSALLTVTTLDSDRNIVSGVPVSIKVDGSGIFSPTTSDKTTDSKGQFSGAILAGADKSNRVIKAIITAGNFSKEASIVVTGSQISVTPLPATPSPGELVTLNISTADSASIPIQYAAINLSGNAGATGSFATDVAGKKTLTFNAPTVAGSYEIVVDGLGVSTTKIIQVVVPGGSGKPKVTAAVSSASLNPVPTTIAANLLGKTVNRSRLSAKFMTAGNVAIQNMRVRFQIELPNLQNGEAISTGISTVYTDASGLVEADYIAGTRTSPTNGVKVRACYSKVDFTSATDCPSWVDATLTVAGTPLSISISDDNTMQKGLGGIAYLKQFLVQINNASGEAVVDAVVSASVDITHYGKGYFGAEYPLGSIAPTMNNLSMAFDPVPVADPVTGIMTYKYIDSVAANSMPPFYVNIGTEASPRYIGNVWCANEDKNRNGFLDSGEDVNGDGVLQPRKAEIIVSYVNGNKTDKNGQLLLQVSYGQNMGRWLAYTLRATTGVDGSEGDVSKSYITDVLKGDVANGSFLTPPFGTKACNSRN